MAKPNHLVYCKGSNTVRQMPQNYCVAVRHPHQSWKLDFDMAADRGLVVKVVDALFLFDNRYGTGENLGEWINKQPSKEQ